MITLKQLKDLDPTRDKPVKLICDTGCYTNYLRVIHVIGQPDTRDRIDCISAYGQQTKIYIHDLKHFKEA